MSEQRFAWTTAMDVATEIVESLRPSCLRIEIAGSLRRHKPDIGDIEILYIPRVEHRASAFDMFATLEVNIADECIASMERAGVLARRLNAKGSQVFGEKNKLMVHVASGIPVDLFAATHENWSNYLVCRTGPKELNQAVCNAAIAKGWKWNPYGAGFTKRGSAEVHAVTNEREVFDFVGLRYAEPEARR